MMLRSAKWWSQGLVASILLLRATGLKYFPMRTLKVCGFNPLDSIGDRALDISEGLWNQDIVILAGTQQRAGSTTDTRYVHHPHHGEVRFGWNHGKFTNKSAGISIYLREKRFGNIVVLDRLFYTFSSIMGRVGGVRIRSNPAVTICGFDFEPRPRTAADVPKYEEGCAEIYEWFCKRVLPFASKGLFIAHGDINSDFGKIPEGRWHSEKELKTALVHLFRKPERIANHFM